MIFINDVDIYKRFNVLFKKGSYDNLIVGTELKEFFSVDSRERHGTDIYFHKPRKKEREVELTFYVGAFADDEYFPNMERFISFLQSSPINLYIQKHNRQFHLIYKSCTNVNRMNFFTNGLGMKFMEFTISFLEPNPHNRSEMNFLADEKEEWLSTENGDLIQAFNIINPKL
jgi:hypothetical protein